MRPSLFMIRRSLIKDWRQLLLTTSAIALAVVVLLSFTSVFTALFARSTHTEWMYPKDVQQQKIEGVTPVKMATQNFSMDMVWQGNKVTDVAIAKTGDASPTIGSLSLPNEGEYYLSPALKKIVDEQPREYLEDRFGTTFIGVLPSSMIETPNTLLVLRGVSDDHFATVPPLAVKEQVYSLASISSTPSGNEVVLMGVMYTGVAIVLIPVLLLIAISIRVGSSQRAQRYAALRLVGFTKRQVRFSILFESWIASLLALVVGLVLFTLAFPVLEGLHFLGDPFWSEDLVLSPMVIGCIALATIAFVSVANWWGLRRVESSPLGVSQTNGAEKKPRVWSLIPLIFGLGVAVFTLTSDADPDVLINIFMIAVISTMIGLFFAGPYLTYHVSRLIGRITRSPLALLGTAYIAKHSRGVFRGVGGVVLAFFAGSFYLMAVSGMGDFVDNQHRTAAESLKLNAVYISGSGVETTLGQKLASIKGVEKVTPAAEYENSLVGISCDDFQAYFTYALQCTSPSEIRAVNMIGTSDEIDPVFAESPVMKETGAYFVLVDTPMTVERIRTQLATSVRTEGGIYTQGGEEASALARAGNATTVLIEELATLAYFGMALTITVATISLSVSTVGSLLERRRSLVTLRLVGVTSAQQKLVVIIESLIPLLLVSIVSVGLGIWFAVGFIGLFADDKLTTQFSPLFVGILVGSLVMAIVAIAASLRFLGKIVSIDAIRSES